MQYIDLALTAEEIKQLPTADVIRGATACQRAIVNHQETIANLTARIRGMEAVKTELFLNASASSNFTRWIRDLNKEIADVKREKRKEMEQHSIRQSVFDRWIAEKQVRDRIAESTASKPSRCCHCHCSCS